MISVCIATYNGEKYIKEQLDSILFQLNVEDEVIISDDGSSDTTLEIIKSYQDSRIFLFENSFKNVVLNFEFVINKAKGDYIFLSDQDDIWHKDKVEVYIKTFSENPKAILTISDLQIIDKNGSHLDKVFYKDKFTSRLGNNLLVNNFIGCAMAFKRDVKKSILPFPKNIAMHDWWIGSCCIMLGEIHFINMKLNFYRRHDNNVTKEGGAKFAKKFKWRFNLVKNLILRYFKIKSKLAKSYRL
jgi:glycosyltransferase involved in cell wall biosynthesis